MVSASLAGITRAILAPILPQLALDKLINHLVEYLSRGEPSSSSEVDKLQQLEHEHEALEDANIKLKMMQGEIRSLHNRDKQNMRLIRINNKIRDVSYEIQDLEGDLEYMELQRKVEEINLQDEADNSPSERRKRRFWFPWANRQSSCHKRPRLSSSQSFKLSTDVILNRMRSIVKQINCIDSKMNIEIKVDQLFQQIALNGVYDPWGQHQVKKNKGRETTSSIKERKIHGRDREIKRLTELLTESINCVGNISVVSVHGMGGIGKTTVAAFVFNSQEIKDHFDNRAWICVTENYNRFRIIKEIIDLLSADDDITLTHDTTSLELLEARLKRRISGKKFLLVLDDVWSSEWQQLSDFLGSAQAKIVKILVTCRNLEVLGSLKGNNIVLLNGLSDEDCWSFFMNCVFVDKNPHNYPKKLHSIGKMIMSKLNGSPLAVKTVGRLLGRNLTEKHWKDVMEGDLWELEIDANDIMSALALSYYHLPQHLQLCFVFCSVFPKNFLYDKLSVIDMWIAHGYIHETRSSSKTMKDIGIEYLGELEAMCFHNGGWDSFNMQPLIHDLARSVSHGEIYTYEGKKGEKISKNVRHLCAYTLFDFGTVCETNNLRTLVLYGRDDVCALLNHEALKRIRVLVIRNLEMVELPDAIANLKHLQYLDLEETNIKSIPESICVLYRLRVLKLPRLHTLPRLFYNLINLQVGNSFEAAHNRSWRPVYIYPLKRGGNYMISQLRNMNDLRGSYLIEGLENFDSREEAMKAKLKEKCHINKLTLSWKDTTDGYKHDAQEEVLEGFQPHPNLYELCIDGYMGSKLPSWLMTMKKLRMLELNKCRNWARLPTALGLLPYLQELCLVDIENVTIEGDDNMTHMFTSLEILELKKTTVSFEAMSSSSSSSSLTTARCRKLFPRLQCLKVVECDRVHGLPWQMFSTLDDLTINASRGVQGLVPGCLENLNSLTSLDMTELNIEEHMGFLLDALHRISSLSALTISKCHPVILSTLGHLSFLTYISLEEVKVMVEDVMPVFPFLHTLKLKKASMIFQNMPTSSSSSSSAVTTQNHNCFPCLNILTIEGCDEVDGLHYAMLSTLKYVSIISSLDRDDQLLPGCLNGLSSLTHLKLTRVKIKSFPTKVMAALHALGYLHLEDCTELISVISVEDLQNLPSLRHLRIIRCPQFRTLYMEHIAAEVVFLPKLSYIDIESCKNLESLPAWLPRLPVLRRLSIIECPKFRSLPEGGLPSSLQTLLIIECDPGLIKRCQQENSPDWLMIEHIRDRIYRF